MPTEVYANGKINMYVDTQRKNGWIRRRGAYIDPDGTTVPYWLELPPPIRQDNNIPSWDWTNPLTWPEFLVVRLVAFIARELTRDVIEASLEEQHRLEQQRAPLAVHPEAIDSVIPDPLPEWGRGR